LSALSESEGIIVLKEKIVCSNGIDLLYQEIDGAIFNDIEIWFHFGSADDPESKSGLAHFIEHLLVFEKIRIIDLFATHNFLASTSKEKIKLSIKTGRAKTFVLLKELMVYAIDFTPRNFYFEYHRQKIIREILYQKKAPIYDFIVEAEKNIFSYNSYKNLTPGTIEGVNSIDIGIARHHLLNMLATSGITISITGKTDIEKIRILLEDIKQPKFGKRIREKTNIKSGVINLTPKEVKHPGGLLYVYDLYKKENCTPVRNIIMNDLLHEYLQYILYEYPFAFKIIDYQYYNFFTVYLPNKNCINRFNLLPSEKINQDNFDIIKNFLFDWFRSYFQNFGNLCRFNIDMYSHSLDIDSNAFVELIKNITFDEFREFVLETLNGNRYEVKSC
jgi:hypothetical protein